MPDSHASATTELAGKYLQLLCKHFGHKVQVDYTPTTGRIVFPFGLCELNAKDDRLDITVSGDSSELDRLEGAVGDHLARFAFRENLTVSWTRTV